jgi:hypothetical protein
MAPRSSKTLSEDDHHFIRRWKVRVSIVYAVLGLAFVAFTAVKAVHNVGDDLVATRDNR